MDSERFLIVEDNAPMARMLSREIGAKNVAAIATSVEEAHALSDELDELTGAVVDIGLPDGDGFDVVRVLRESRPALPVLVITGDFTPEVANRCQMLGVEFLCKPGTRDNLRVFVQRATWARRISREELARYVASFSERHCLTRRERDVLALALRGMRRPEIARRRNLQETTIKMQIRSLIKKTGHGSLNELVLRVLREAWVARSEAS